MTGKTYFLNANMPERHVLLLGEHSHGHEHGRERAMNIACGVVIAIVIIAMIVATIVYFCVGKDGGGGQTNDASQTATKKVAEVKTMKNSHVLPGPKPSSSSFGQVPVHEAPKVEGPIFPKLSAEDERELAKTHQLSAVKNYAQGQRNSILTDMKYQMIHDKPPIFRTADFFPYRGKEDEKMYQLQTDQARRFKTNFNQTDDFWSLQERGIRPEFT